MEPPNEADVPDCHARGVQPEGYSAKEETCPQCIFKFTCLPASVELGLAGSLALDLEVLAVSHGRLSLTTALERMEQRAQCLRTRQEVPESLLPGASLELVSDLIAGEAANQNVVAPSEESSSIRRMTTRDRRRNWAPYPREITAEQMRNQLASTEFKKRGVRIGQPFPLQLGMVIVRKKTRREIAVHLRERGFEYEGALYPTLSAAAIAAESRSVSGNDFFSLENMSVEIRDASGMVLVRGGKEFFRPRKEKPEVVE